MTEVINIYDLNWDTDGEDVDLPHEVTIELDVALSEETLNKVIDLVSEELSEYLTNRFGYTHNGFVWEFDSDSL